VEVYLRGRPWKDYKAEAVAIIEAGVKLSQSSQERDDVEESDDDEESGAGETGDVVAPSMTRIDYLETASYEPIVALSAGLTFPAAVVGNGQSLINGQLYNAETATRSSCPRAASHFAAKGE
jgi:hypothetical protein